jgi:carbonic anhydrase/acetyltransferase-like protein (isoleucine patch superfamily)
MLHGCTLEDNVLIGMGATVLNGAKIGANSLIGAGALVTEGKEIPPGSLVMGAPGKVVRELDEAAIEGLRASALQYAERMRRFRAELTALGGASGSLCGDHRHHHLASGRAADARADDRTGRTDRGRQ